MVYSLIIKTNPFLYLGYLIMKKVKGDLIKLGKEGHFDVIVHGCNCFCTMGAGIAATVKKEFPEAWLADKMSMTGDKLKLGNYTSANFKIGDHTLTVVNAYTQYQPAGDGPQIDYDALREVFYLINRDFSGKRIGYPAIGAGLAGGDWDKIAGIIDKEMDGQDHTFVEFQPS